MKISYWMSRNISLKITSFVIALIAVLLVRSEKGGYRKKTLALEFIPPPGYIVIGQAVYKVDILLKTSNLGVAFDNKPIQIRYSIKEGWKGIQKIHISPRYLEGQIGAGARVSLAVNDQFFDVEMDRFIQLANVPVKAVTQGTPKNGFSVKKILTHPKHLALSGAESELMFVEEVSTKPIDINGIDSNRNYTVALDLSSFKTVRPSLDQVSVRVEIHEPPSNKTFADVPIEFKNLAAGRRVVATEKSISVEIQGTTKVLSFVAPEDIQAMVDVSGLSPGVYEKPITVKIPSDTILIETSPTMVHFRIQ